MLAAEFAAYCLLARRLSREAAVQGLKGRYVKNKRNWHRVVPLKSHIKLAPHSLGHRVDTALFRRESMCRGAGLKAGLTLGISPE